MIKLLIGGSPCTRWSIAQTKNRETEPSGIGWELFENYLIALEKFKPDFFLYENNKSMSKAIREEITRRFGFEPICINSSKLSAQNRQRLYWCGKRNPDGTYSAVLVQQPEDRGILLRDILETGQAWNEKGYTLTTRCCGAIPEDTLKRHRHTMVAEPVSTTKDEKPYTLKADYYKSGPANAFEGHFPAPMTAEPVSVDLQVVGRKKNENGEWEGSWEARTDGKSSTLTQVESRRMVAEPIRIGTFPNSKGELKGGQGQRIYGVDAKDINLTANGGGQGTKTGLYAIPFSDKKIGVFPNENGELTQCQSKRIYSIDAKGRVLNAGPGGLGVQTGLYAVPQEYDVYQEIGFTATGETVEKTKFTPVYEVRNGLIAIKGKQYPIKLADGFYIIRKLTVTECKRLQTVPDSYVFPVYDTQAYKMLGNGWTVDVITHILLHCQGITDEPLDVLSMYDGMACGHIALDKLGATIHRYRATEIDKYAIKTACHNFPDIIQLGDAFQVREWE